MEVVVREAGCWHLTPPIHTLSPLAWVGHHTVGIEQFPGMQGYKSIQAAVPLSGKDLIIKPGMLFELEPNVSRGKQRVNLGGTVIITEEIVEELNKLSTELCVVE